MKLTREQALKIIKAAPLGSPYYQEAQRVLQGQPLLGQDAGIRQDDDDGYPD